MNCPICEKHQNINNPIYKSENWVISHGPLASQVLGYVYIEPKRHVENWSEFTDNELAELGPLIKKVEEAMKKELPMERLYTVTISEAVRHIHVHLIPRLDEMSMKGVPLIEQATQQNSNENSINQAMIDDLSDKLEKHLNH